MVVEQSDIDVFADMTVAELLMHIQILTAEIEYAQSQLQPHDTGHIHTAINWMTERILQLENQIRNISALSSAG